MEPIQFDQLLIAALKEKNELKTNTIRALKSAVKNKEIEKGSALDTHEVIDVISKEAKKRKDARDLYLSNNRPDLADNEIAELEIISSFLPEQLSGEKLEEKVREIAATVPEADKGTGKAIGLFMKELKGKADPADIQAAIKKITG